MAKKPLPLLKKAIEFGTYCKTLAVLTWSLDDEEVYTDENEEND